MSLSGVVDTVLDRSVVLGFSRVGLSVRSRLPGWPADPPPGALAGRDVAITGATSGLGLAVISMDMYVSRRETEVGAVPARPGICRARRPWQNSRCRSPKVAAEMGRRFGALPWLVAGVE